MGPRCFKCLMFSPSGPVELVFLVDLGLQRFVLLLFLWGWLVVIRFFSGVFYNVFLFCVWLCL